MDPEGDWEDADQTVTTASNPSLGSFAHGQRCAYAPFRVALGRYSVKGF